jgi:hypothetical protein
MDYATVRALFFSVPDEERAPAPAAGHRSPARRLRDAIEPVACQSIWSLESAEGYEALGLGDFFAAYVWQRTAALGTPPTALAVAALGVFAPALVGPPYETGRAALSSRAVSRIRREAPGATVRRVLGDVDDEAGPVVTALRRGLAEADVTARPLFAGLAAEPWPDDVLAQLVHACNLLREHRGDSHLAVCAVAGLDPVEMNVLTELYCGYELGGYSPSRGWTVEEIDAAAVRLRTRGLVEAGSLTPEGLQFRDGLEAQTDAMQQSIVDGIGPDIDDVAKRLGTWSDALVAAGAAPPDPAKRAAG